MLLGVAGEEDWAETVGRDRGRRHAALLHRRRDRDAGRGHARFGEVRLREAMARGRRRPDGAAGRDRACAARVPGRRHARRPRDARAAVLRRRGARRSMRSRYDVVVVGGGHNGLVAAAYLARAGRSVLVLERADRMGGAAVSEAPFAGVDARLSRYSYLVSLLPRWSWRRSSACASRRAGGGSPPTRRCPAPTRPCSSTPRTPTARARRSSGRPGTPRRSTPGRRSTTASARVARAVFPTMLEPLVSRDELRAPDRRRRGLGRAVRAADRRERSRRRSPTTCCAGSS